MVASEWNPRRHSIVKGIRTIVFKHLQTIRACSSHWTSRLASLHVLCYNLHEQSSLSELLPLLCRNKMLDAIRYLVCWMPIILTVLHFTFKAMGLEHSPLPVVDFIELPDNDTAIYLPGNVTAEQALAEGVLNQTVRAL